MDLLISLLITLLVLGLILWLVLYIISLVPMPAPFKQVATIIVYVIALLVLINCLWPLVGTHTLFYRH